MIEVPEGWKFEKLEVHIDLISGFAFKSAQYSENETDIKLLRGANVSQGNLRWKDVKYWPDSEALELGRYYLEAGDIVVSMDRTWIPAGLKVAVVKSSDLPSLLVQRVARLRVKKTLTQSLLATIIQSNRFEGHVKRSQTETAVPHISPNDIRDYKIYIAPLPEQQRIAQILGTWDRAIAATEALITASEAQKKALMQQLLTGKRRLPGFKGEWQKVKLGDVADIIVSNVNKKTIETEATVRLCNYMDVYNREHIENDQEFMVATASKAQVSKFRLLENDVIITKDSETPEDIAIPSVVRSTAPDLICGYHLAILRPKNNVSGEFLKYLLSDPQTRYYFATHANGATRFGLTLSAIEQAKFHLPGIKEQKSIAELLSLSQKEIEAYQAKLQTLKTEKAALMQQLLTGKRRVKLTEAAA